MILKHNQIRGGVSTQGLSYIETIPIILYGIIVVVVLNAILLASPLNVRPIRLRHNLIPTLAYWPVVLGLLRRDAHRLLPPLRGELLLQ